MEIQLVIFNLGSESFGVEISAVESIIKMQAITSVPQAPAFIEGVTNLRGRVLPVLDLRKRLGLITNKMGKDSRIIVAEMNGLVVGMIVDSVNEVLRISQDTIESPPSFFNSVDTRFLKGIVRLENQLALLLDLSQVLTLDELAAAGQLTKA